jgi:hypothetical protein
MTVIPRPQETILSRCARRHLAAELGIEPDELEYIGVQKGIDYDLILFNVDRPGPGNGTTRSVRVDK